MRLGCLCCTKKANRSLRRSLPGSHYCQCFQAFCDSMSVVHAPEKGQTLFEKPRCFLLIALSLVPVEDNPSQSAEGKSNTMFVTQFAPRAQGFHKQNPCASVVALGTSQMTQVEEGDGRTGLSSQLAPDRQALLAKRL